LNDLNPIRFSHEALSESLQSLLYMALESQNLSLAFKILQLCAKISSNLSNDQMLISANPEAWTSEQIAFLLDKMYTSSSLQGHDS